MRVLVVDDSAFMRRAIRSMLETDPDVEVVGVARNGREGLDMAKKLRPDVVTLDIEMPEMDGLTALRHIMRECPTQVIMLSSLTTEGSHAALKAMSLGAADVLAKDSSQISLTINTIRDDLVARVRTLAKAAPKRNDAPPAESDATPAFRPGQFDAVCIGSSTGGPPVLESLVKRLPETFASPVVIAQHMPPVFTKSMAERLDALTPLRVLHAEDAMPLERGTIYVAPGGLHTTFRKAGLGRYQLAVGPAPADALYRPSVDVLFASAAHTLGSRTLAIVLTGMGADGLIGGRDLKKTGATLLAQSAETCVVYGMPKAVTENALVLASLSPKQISDALATLALNTAAA